MSWHLSGRVDLTSPAIPASDARRQEQTAAEILRRFDDQPGQILADEVGMGKTFVALAVAVSVIEATGADQPVVVMVPSAVSDKWPLEWTKFARSLGPGKELRATAETITSGTDFLKLLDDPPATRKQLIFLTHGALSRQLSDPFVQLAIIKRALRSPRLKRQRELLPRWADRIIRGFSSERIDEGDVRELLARPHSQWRSYLTRARGVDPGDDPVPQGMLDALDSIDLSELRSILEDDLPRAASRTLDERLRRVRGSLGREVRSVWKQALTRLDVELPLLILDEAHHTKNAGTRLASLFANETAEEAADAVSNGELAGMFRRMLFLTATPFQLGHDELIAVLERFCGVRWGGDERERYEEQLGELRQALDASQMAALRLDRAWGRLTRADVAGNSAGWWAHADSEVLTPAAGTAAGHWVAARDRARTAERLLRRHVVRHTRVDRDSRRASRYGGQLAGDEADSSRGLEIGGEAVLPFLLAARAQALVSMHGLRKQADTRALFADGLASSFEAYARTRVAEDIASELDDAALVGGGEPLPDEVQWYLSRISESLAEDRQETLVAHPKIAATVARAVELWARREKSLVFCFYIATGRALRRHIAVGIEAKIVELGAAKLGLPNASSTEVHEALERFRERLFDPASPARRFADKELGDLLRPHLGGEELDVAAGVCLRFLRTASFLVRYVDLARDPLPAMQEAFEVQDASGRSFRELVADFGRFLAEREPDERLAFIDALQAIAVGGIAVDDEEGEQGQLIANVRLANGSVGTETRRRLMRAFNTPFFPEVLVASSVMAEGVDLHLMCRHVIHHDLDWNPSVIEQRTGRLDRLGSKGERTGQPVEVFLPFTEGAQDEKQFRVMRDRERWFNVVMGEPLELDEWATDRLAERVELPAEAAGELAMDLAVATIDSISERPSREDAQRN